MLIRQKRARHFKRYQEIAATLARHGLGWLALELNLGGQDGCDDNVAEKGTVRCLRRNILQFSL